ncbi:hypothetical protein P5673_033627, partial [Acropora cervicornis]
CEIRNAAKESMFIQDMASVLIEMITVATWRKMLRTASIVEAFDVAANKIQSEGKLEFALLYRVQLESYKKYSD